MKRIIAVILCLMLLCAAFIVPAAAGLGPVTRSLIDASPLIPLMTGYTPLDQMVADFFASNFSEDMDTYDKLKICYDYLVYDSVYGESTVTDSLFREIDRECNYYSSWDRDYAAEGYAFIKDKHGSCNHFASAFMVMARAIGLECYVMHGTITWYAGTNSHYWNLIKLGSGYYMFDPEAEWRNYDNNGYISYSNFCVSETLNSSRTCNRTECINDFGNFQCRNKKNEPGTTIPGRADIITNVYLPGLYLLNDAMNFRSDHSITSGIFSILPSGITVEVDEVNGIWGRITFDGTTGWISLDYSSRLSDKKEEPSGYQTGVYVTDEVMYFRSDHEITAFPYGLIPKGTELQVTEICGVWGKTTYNGRTGWMSLEYSTLKTPDPESAAIAGDADGDGKLTSQDARLILRHSVSLERIDDAFLVQSDITGDGKITSEDARLALRASVHLD